MLKIGSTVYKIQHSNDKERVLLTVWHNRRLVDHGICKLRRGAGGCDVFTYHGDRFYVSEFA